MTITIEETLHGGIILELLSALAKEKKEVYHSFRRGKSTSAYYFEIQKDEKKSFNFFRKDEQKTFKIGCYIKTSRARRSPWRYTFIKEHQAEIEEMKKETDQVFVLLLAGTDGVALLAYEQLKKLLDEQFEDNEWLSVSRKFNQYYRVDGHDGKKKLNVPKNSFPSDIVAYIKSKL